MKRTENYSTDFVSRDYYSYLVQLRQRCNMLLTRLEAERDPEVQEEFKMWLTLLTREMKPKYERREDMSVPEQLQGERAGKVSELSVKDCTDVLSSISTLQERLGITSMARNKYEMDSMGAVDAEAER